MFFNIHKLLPKLFKEFKIPNVQLIISYKKRINKLIAESEEYYQDYFKQSSWETDTGPQGCYWAAPPIKTPFE